MGNITLNKNSIKLYVEATNYYYDKNNVTCKAVFNVDMPDILRALIGGISGVVKATAFCAEDDVYNKTIGEKIALAKAESYAYKRANAMLTKRLKLIEDIICLNEPLVEDFSNKAKNCIEHNSNYIETISSADYVRDFIKESSTPKGSILTKVWKKKNGSANKKA